MLFEIWSGFFRPLKSVNNRLTPFPICKNTADLVGNWNKRNVTRSLVEKYTFYLIFNNMDHYLRSSQADCATCLKAAV